MHLLRRQRMERNRLAEPVPQTWSRMTQLWGGGYYQEPCLWRFTVWFTAGVKPSEPLNSLSRRSSSTCRRNTRPPSLAPSLKRDVEDRRGLLGRQADPEKRMKIANHDWRYSSQAQ